VLASWPDGVNGMAGDDLVMTVVFLGAILVAAAIVADPRLRRDGLRLTIVGTWVAMVAITVLEGFYIELNHDQFGAALASNDAAFSVAHPMTGIFLMIVVSLALLLVDFYGVKGQMRRVVTAIGAAGLIAAAVGTTLWTFVDPSNSGPVYGLYIAGIAISYVTILVAAVAVRSAQTQGFSRPIP
jgi:cytochrome c oxidase subunit IV